MKETNEENIWTDLFDGRKVIKDNLRIELCGDIDEANSALGLARATTRSKKISGIIHRVQKDLFTVGAECATLVMDLHHLPKRIDNDDIAFLKKLYEEVKVSVPPVKGFITPGDTFPSANLHLARTIIRRAERAAVKLHREGQISSNIVRYLDVLSDLVFYLAVFEEEPEK